jgi:hypothetical protein
VSRFLFAAIISAMFAFAQEPARPADLHAGNFATIEGHVTDASGHPIRKAGLTLSQGGTPLKPPYNAITDAEGKFSFDEITPGGYTLSVERAGYLTQRYRASPRETISTIILTAGQHLKEINVTLARAVTISGRVLDEAGDPVANVTVRLLRRTLQSGLGLTALRFVNTDESGEYHVPDLSAGQYYLSAGVGNGTAFSILGMRAVRSTASDPPAKPGDSREYYADTFYPAEREQRAARAIDILHDDMQGLDIHLWKTRAFLVSGKLVGTVPGHPLEQCQIVLTPADLPSVMSPGPQGTVTRIAKDGSFGFSGSHFPPGDYFIMAIVSGGRQMLLARQRLVVGNRDIDDAVLSLQPLVELHGSVAIEGEQQTDFSAFSGTPPPSVTMHIGLSLLNSPMVSDVGSRIKADDGSFAIADIAPGAYEVRVSGIPGDRWVKSIRLGSQEVTDRRIEVTRATGAMPLQIMLSRSVGLIEGIVERDPGKPAASSALTVFGDPLGKGVTMLTGVQEDGRFTLPRLPPGTYRLYAWEDLEEAQRYDPVLLKAYESMSARVTVEENGIVRVTLREIPAPAPQQ